ncbi:MAG TPA: hypothetical protein VN802_19165 [Stellaceae bacterium]|nr:hypothetical protein [Stellaceae bacterium]
MGKWIWAAGLAGLVSACGSFTGTIPTVPSRDAVGVTAHQPSTGEAATVAPDVARKLDWKTSQICTLGSQTIAEAVVPGENDNQFVDRQFYCAPYGFSVLGVSFAGLVPF